MRVYLRLSLPGCQDLGLGLTWHCLLALLVSLTFEASTDSTRRLRTLESCGVGTGRLHPISQSSKLQAPNGPDRMDPHHIAWELRTAWPGPRARFSFRRCRQLRVGNRDWHTSVRRFRIEGAGLAAGKPGGSFIAHPNGRLSE
jgi:hypothetical protein